MSHTDEVTEATVTDTNGKVWRLGFEPRDAGVRLNRLAREHFTREALATRRLIRDNALGESWLAERLDAIEQDKFCYGTPAFDKFMGEVAGPVVFVLSLLIHHQHDATFDDAKRLVETCCDDVTAAVRLIHPQYLSQCAVKPTDNPSRHGESASFPSGFTRWPAHQLRFLEINSR